MGRPPIRRARAGEAFTLIPVYFFDEEHALAYASRWGRMWIDNRKRGQ